jgi:hypothetical protein
MTAKKTGKPKTKPSEKAAEPPYSPFFGSVPFSLKQHISPHGRLAAAVLD